MATLAETQEAYDRHGLRVGVLHSDVADVILRLERERARLRAALDRYVSADDCEYGDGPPCPGDIGVPWCMYCQACAALAVGEG